MPQKKKSPKRPDEYRRNKRAFDSVLRHVRRIGRPWLKPSKAINPENIGSGGGSMNPMKPTTVDFWADVCRAIKTACPKDVSLVKFHLAYTLFDSVEAIDIEQHAHKTLGDRRHSVEQRIGAEFIRRKIWPVQGKGYFYALRKKR
jgi:hypothetical protein